jgi:hypothetical protein
VRALRKSFPIYPFILAVAAMTPPYALAEDGVEQRAARVCAAIGSGTLKSQGAFDVDNLNIKGNANGTLTISREGVDLGQSAKGTYENYTSCLIQVMKLLAPPGRGEIPPSARDRVAGWLATFGAREHGGGSFGQYSARTCLVSTPAAIDIRPFLPPGLSPRNLFIEMKATTDHQVVEPGRWVYALKINGAPSSYTQCMTFEVQSDGVPIGGGAMPILTGVSSALENSSAAVLDAGTHNLSVKLACYFQGGQFPVVSLMLKTPSGQWRVPSQGDLTTTPPSSPDKPPSPSGEPACLD